MREAFLGIRHLSISRRYRNPSLQSLCQRLWSRKAHQPRSWSQQRKTHHGHSVHQRNTRNLVFLNANHVCGGTRGRFQKSLNGLNTLQSGLTLYDVRSGTSKQTYLWTYQNSVKSARSPTTLRMSERCNTGIETEFIGKDVLDVVCLDWVIFAIFSTLCDNDNSLSLSYDAVLNSNA